MHNLTIGGVELHLPPFGPIYHMLEMLQNVLIVTRASCTKNLSVVGKFEYRAVRE